MSTEAVKFGFIAAVVISIIIFLVVRLEEFSRNMDSLLQERLGEEGAEQVRSILSYILVFLFLVFLFAGIYETFGPTTRELFLEAIR